MSECRQRQSRYLVSSCIRLIFFFVSSFFCVSYRSGFATIYEYIYYLLPSRLQVSFVCFIRLLLSFFIIFSTSMETSTLVNTSTHYSRALFNINFSYLLSVFCPFSSLDSHFSLVSSFVWSKRKARFISLHFKPLFGCSGREK
jgi:hypothetical protein